MTAFVDAADPVPARPLRVQLPADEHTDTPHTAYTPIRVAGPIKVGRAESRATVITDAWTPWDAYTDVLR